MDIRFRWPDRSVYRDRRVVDMKTEAAALRWGEARESEIRAAGQVKAVEPSPKQKVMTVAEFAPKFVNDYARADGHGEGGIEAKESILRIHLVPHIGHKKLDEVTAADVQLLKRIWREGIVDRATGKVLVKPTNQIKTLNNRLTVLAKMLKIAVAWTELTGLTALRCDVKLMKGDDSKEMGFYEHAVFDTLVEGAAKAGSDELLAVLLGGEAGLRRGEILGAQWADVVRGKLHVQRQVYSKRTAHAEELNAASGAKAGRTPTITPTKGKAKRWVPLTPRLMQAISKHRHLRGTWMLCQADGSPLTPKLLKLVIQRAERRAALEVTGRTHILRHTFCSHLAMAGASPITIQSLAGHENLETTMGYMHLSPNATDEAIGLLVKSRQSVASRGNIVATATEK